MTTRWTATCDECGELVTEIKYDAEKPRIEPGSLLAPEEMLVSSAWTVEPCGHHGGWTATGATEQAAPDVR